MPKISRVKLLKKDKRNGNWILVPALFDSKGRVRRDHVMIEGRDEALPTKNSVRAEPIALGAIHQ